MNNTIKIFKERFELPLSRNLTKEDKEMLSEYCNAEKTFKESYTTSLNAACKVLSLDGCDDIKIKVISYLDLAQDHIEYLAALAVRNDKLELIKFLPVFHPYKVMCYAVDIDRIDELSKYLKYGLCDIRNVAFYAINKSKFEALKFLKKTSDDKYQKYYNIKAYKAMLTEIENYILDVDGVDALDKLKMLEYVMVLEGKNITTDSRIKILNSNKLFDENKELIARHYITTPDSEISIEEKLEIFCAIPAFHKASLLNYAIDKGKEKIVEKILLKKILSNQETQEVVNYIVNLSRVQKGYSVGIIQSVDLSTQKKIEILTKDFKKFSRNEQNELIEHCIIKAQDIDHKSKVTMLEKMQLSLEVIRWAKECIEEQNNIVIQENAVHQDEQQIFSHDAQMLCDQHDSTDYIGVIDLS